jgi:hypothetical protein
MPNRVNASPCRFGNNDELGLSGNAVNHLFSSVIVDVQVTILNLTNKFWPLIQTVGNRFAQRAFRQYLLGGFIQPIFKLSQ